MLATTYSQRDIYLCGRICPGIRRVPGIRSVHILWAARASFLPGNIVWSSRLTENVSRQQDWEFAYQNTATPSYSSDAVRVVANHNLSYAMNNTAASLSKLSIDFSGRMVAWTAQTAETYVTVRWQWLILPITLVASGLLLFIATMTQTHRCNDSLWRSSLLPVLYGHIEMPAGSNGCQLTDVARTEAQARRDKIRAKSVDVDESL